MAKFLEVQYFYPFLNMDYAEAFMAMENSDQPMNIIVSEGYGGYCDTLNLLLSLIENSKKPTMTIVPSVAMSCNLGLFVAGTKGLRIVSPRATCLLHQVGSGAIGKASDIESENKEIQRLNNELAYKLYDKAGGHEEGFTKNLVKENFNADLYLTPEQMVEYGWADKIMSVNEIFTNLDNLYKDYEAMKDKIEINESLEIMPTIPAIGE